MWEFLAKKSDRLDRQLRECEVAGSDWFSRQAWDWLIDQGQVRVEGRVVRKAGQRIEVGNRIQVSFPSSELGLALAKEAAELVWGSPEAGLAIFTKKSGVPTISLFPWEHGSFANQVAAFLEREGWLKAADFAALAPRPSLEGGVLQRLDQFTSGLVMVALNPPSKRLFRELFSRSALEKSYLALVTGSAAALAGSHELWLSTEGGASVRAAREPLKGKCEKVSINIEICKSSPQGACVRVRTRFGLRHVVRASMAALGAPLLGDARYGGSALVPHHQLHAESLRLLEPSAFPQFPQGLTAPPPQGFLDSAALLGLHLPG